jgi:hypothetical protein
MVSGPPVSGSPYGNPYGGYTPAPAPPARRGSFAFPALIALAVILLIGTVVVAVLGVGQIGDLRDDVSTLEAERDAQKAKDVAAAAKLEEDFKAADLPKALTKVKDADKATDTAYNAWKNAGAKFGPLNTSMQTCDAAISDYDRAAAPFPADKFSAALPAKIDLDNRETDCGRAFINTI